MKKGKVFVFIGIIVCCFVALVVFIPADGPDFLVRCHNQVWFSLFGKTCSPDIFKGKNGELFLKANLDEITGKMLENNFSCVEEAQKHAQHNVESTLALVDSLHRRGKTFLFIFAPTKTAVYPEWMPRNYREHIADFSLEEYYIQLFKENHIPHIDFYHYFQTYKDESPYPLYTPMGSHWAQHTMPMVADSIFRYLEALTGNPYPTVVRADNSLSTQYTVHDIELEEPLKLLFPLKRPALPEGFGILNDTVDGNERPKLLVVGDGNFTQLKLSCFKQAFSEWDFWVYNKYYQASRPNSDWGELEYYPHRYEVLDGADIVMVVVSAPYLYKYMFGFEQTAYQLWAQGPVDNEKAIELKIEEIKSVKEWYDAIVNQAEELGITVEDNLRRNAKYILDQQQQK